MAATVLVQNSHSKSDTSYIFFKKSYLVLLKVKNIYLTRFQPAQNRRSFNFSSRFARVSPSTSYSPEKRKKIAPVFCGLTRFVKKKKLTMKLLSSASNINFTNGTLLQINYFIVFYCCSVREVSREPCTNFSSLRSRH